jgi:glycogen synthase
MPASSVSEEAVRFLGFVSPVQRAIEDAAIVVVPSLGEGFGMVALEGGAMERARPVIASAVGGASGDRRERRDRAGRALRRMPTRSPTRSSS